MPFRKKDFMAAVAWAAIASCAVAFFFIAARLAPCCFRPDPEMFVEEVAGCKTNGPQE